MLLRNFGQTASKAKPGEEACRELVSSYARLQRSLAGEVERLTRMGCLDRRLKRLGEHFTALLADDAVWASLKPREAQALRAREAELMGLLERLDAYGIPPSLLHGDLHLGNVAVGESHRVFDWTDACIAHPFLDLATLLEDLSHTYDPQTTERLRTDYLEVWQDYGPLERLYEASRVAEVVGCLHQAVSYWHIIGGLEEAAKGEFATSIPFWLRRGLELAEKL